MSAYWFYEIHNGVPHFTGKSARESVLEKFRDKVLPYGVRHMVLRVTL